ncbi:hypothetical protein [Dyella sp.]|uniref:ArnT family glycosyltransferase n=1 Tax=Dyella sp. TaxID=1869338 RepID=UPI002D77C61D|nr:hypothetical protein [Dyella sp.]HET6432109.1 hypothetical protein [Dyella sp.]
MLLLLVGLAAASARFHYVTQAQVLQRVDDQSRARGDGVEYYAYARNLAQHGVFSMAPEGEVPPVRDSFRDPGYPAFLALWMRIFPSWPQWYAAVLLSQALISALSVVLTVGIGRHWMPPSWLFGAGLLMAIWPHSIAMNSYILSESLVGFLCAAAMLVMSRTVEKPRVRPAAAGGFTMALAGLSNAVLLPFAPLVAGWLWWRGFAGKQVCAALLLGATLLPAAWICRNATLPAGQSPQRQSSSQRALMNLDQGAWPEYHAAFHGSINGDQQSIVTMNKMGQEIALLTADTPRGLQQVLARLARTPWQSLAWYARKPALLWDWDIRIGQGDIYTYPTRHSPFVESASWRAIEALCHALNPFLLLAMIGGGVAALVTRRGAPPAVQLVSLLLVWVTLVHTALQAEPRYAEPYRPIQILLAAWFCYSLSVRIRTWRNARLTERDPIHESGGQLPSD